MKKTKTTEVIQNVASELFQRFGFEKTSMDDIARRAHKAKRSIYYHFNSKEALFCATVNNELLNVREKLQATANDGSSPVLSRISNYLLQRVELIAEARTLQVALQNKMLDINDYRFEDLKNTYQDFLQWEHSVFSKFWHHRPTTDTEDAVSQQADAFADMLQVVLNGLSHSFFVEGKYATCKSSYEMLVKMIVNSIGISCAQNQPNNNI